MLKSEEAIMASIDEDRMRLKEMRESQESQDQVPKSFKLTPSSSDEEIFEVCRLAAKEILEADQNKNGLVSFDELIK